MIGGLGSIRKTYERRPDIIRAIGVHRRRARDREGERGREREREGDAREGAETWGE